jgi:hypothetical protein
VIVFHFVPSSATADALTFAPPKKLRDVSVFPTARQAVGEPQEIDSCSGDTAEPVPAGDANLAARAEAAELALAAPMQASMHAATRLDNATLRTLHLSRTEVNGALAGD